MESACGQMPSPLSNSNLAGSTDHPAHAAWTAVLERAKLELPPAAFDMWFSALEPGKSKGRVVELVAPSGYVRSWLSGHYMDLIAAAVADRLGPAARVHLRAARLREDASASQASGGPLGRSADGSIRPHPDPGEPATQQTLDRALAELSPFPERYTFDTFVPGPSNKFAHAAALAVAEAPPSKAYNPLFVYGGVGLGKTHLLFAIANHMLTLAPRTRVRYVTSESFVTEFIKSVRERRGYLFQREYRDVDVLLLDDVQFLARAEETQTEFFHTFNHLHQHERQIVIASDRPPQELGGIEERLRSRFRSGLVVDVQPPDLETRIAILQLKALRDRLAVQDDVLHFIASKFENNIRELEGALLRVNAFASISRQPVDLELAERALEDLIPESGQEITPQAILEVYLLRELTGLSLIKIGELFERDHTTALHGIKKIEGLMQARGSVYRQVHDLTKKVRARGRGM